VTQTTECHEHDINDVIPSFLAGERGAPLPLLPLLLLPLPLPLPPPLLLLLLVVVLARGCGQERRISHSAGVTCGKLEHIVFW